jgi:iron complex transport system substrate-binding protein
LGRANLVERSRLKKSFTVFLPLAAILTWAGVSALARQVTDQTGRRVNVPEHPQRVVSLAPSLTEIVYALGVGDRLVGDTDYCDYPPEARQKPHVGAMVNPSLERIVALKPDLVLGSADANRRETADQLERLGIPLYGLAAHTLEDTLRSMGELGRVLGREAEAEALLARLRARIESVEKRMQGRPRSKVLFVVWYRPLITAGSQTFIADVIRRAGGVSISDDLRGEWPHLSLEEVLRRDPDIILLPKTETFSPGLDEFQHLPGWKELRAVKSRQMYFVPETIMRPCPRLVDALEDVADILHSPTPSQAEAPR